MFYIIFDRFIVCSCFCFKQTTAYEMRISDSSSDVCSSYLAAQCQQDADQIDDCQARTHRRRPQAVPGFAFRPGAASWPPRGKDARSSSDRTTDGVRMFENSTSTASSRVPRGLRPT